MSQWTPNLSEIDAQSAELMVLLREGDGWKISAIHWSSRSRRR